MEPLLDAERPWSLPRRLAVRFGALYLPIYLLSGLGTASLAPLGKVAARVLGVRLPPDASTGSGDRAVDWCAVGGLLVLSALGAAVWTALIGGDRATRATYEALRVALRYLLATALLMYGFGKTTQFGSPSLTSYAEPLGRMAPMDLLWAFMGYSAPYALFTGAIEVAGAFLLLFRRTTTLGALAYAGAMLNVFALNLCYDVPVKLFSFHLLLGALVLLLPDVRRLVDLLILNRPTTPRELGPPVRRRKLRTAVLTLKWAFVATMLVGFGNMSIAGWRRLHATPSPLSGIWKATRYEGAGPRWDWALIDAEEQASVMALHLVGGERRGDRIDVQGRTLTLGSTRRGTARRWRYGLDGPDRLRLVSLPGEPTERVELVRDPDRFPLMRHGFHWVQEHPYTL